MGSQQVLAWSAGKYHRRESGLSTIKGKASRWNSFLTELLKKKINFIFKSYKNFLQKIRSIQLIDSQHRFLIFSSDFSIFKKSAIRSSLIFLKSKNQIKKSENHIDYQHFNTYWFFEGYFLYFIFREGNFPW